ncbi:Multiphosphoryl transfer protein (Includes: Phosphoenolpyruvate-protein phosphotransferase; Phosphocarrier protein HPr; Fructose-specific phosphotransferase enzyme IIA component) [uncultured Pleomorphomonas sp.]|uniref:phosphoenolpyruvate--protein phosphotransferase n=1 Tax=uncultured Pleomorphomonas sp. TaxID=442121 RepID=A0A212LFL2_9HYPH|nr:phosphoenolpyruvate--protein phosphotransferase [uncultured Pleomorphomonas sp.]SCM76352.1 Multiphosphoryl transfer protein (Includes: Phosphoenolpyruvate-protein phosphotransferase; Phosphocarrier protein HPr; Fructose-specific phosphotransferase enzyme IIA component) [uncultured Pleomorphomonas sp.]
MSVLQLFSPFAGRALPLTASPDPVFAGGLIGDGLAIDPEVGELRAPCAGIVASLQASGHALTIRSDTGAEILLHIGVDTVNLGGAGFRPLVREGQHVATGEWLIDFDLPAMRPKVASMVSMMVVANGEAFGVASVVTDRPVGFGDPIMTVAAVGDTVGISANSSEAAEFSLPLKIAHGLHARPAAQFANAAKAHAGAVHVTANGKTANGKSVVALMGLGTRFGDILNIRVEGPGADATVDTLLDLVLSGLGDPIADGPAPEADVAALAARTSGDAPVKPFRPGTAVALRGRSAVAGLAAGRIVRRYHDARNLPRDGTGISIERDRLAAARARVLTRLSEETEGPRAAVAAAHREIVDDPALVEAAEADIAAGRSAEWAWNTACLAQADMLAGLADARMAERAADMRDVAGQVVAALAGRDAVSGLADLPAGSLVLSDEILPSETTGLTPGHIGAILMRDGGPTSHAAIIAAGLGIPTIVALGPEADRIPDGAEVVVDAGLGTVTVYPTEAELAAARSRIAGDAGRKASQRANAQAECRLADGTRVEVFANLGRVGEGALAVAEGAEGCGLLRSEFLFLDRTSAPSEDEQLAQYQAIADELGGRPLIIRTLDVGGDKPLSYLPLPKEENPFLGLRGIRVGLIRPELLRTQLRAILRVKPYGVARIMVPMVASVTEMITVRTMVEEERLRLGRVEPIQLGAMIEIPAAAVAARQLAEVCDFFSIGTNDLTQYALAMDRGNPAVAAGVDALHPGVLGLIRLACEGAGAHGRVVAVCGGAASDPSAAPILVGLGVRELSAAPAAIPEIKAALAAFTVNQCQALAERAVQAQGAAEVRALAGASA